MFRAARFVSVALATALLGACTDISSHSSGSPTPAATASSAPAPTSTPAPVPTRVATPAVVPLFTRTTEIKDAIFEPELVVAPGTEVTWINRDAVLHTVTAKDGSSDSNAFDRLAASRLGMNLPELAPWTNFRCEECAFAAFRSQTGAELRLRIARSTCRMDGASSSGAVSEVPTSD